jgi:hypothetical protein
VTYSFLEGEVAPVAVRPAGGGENLHAVVVLEVLNCLKPLKEWCHCLQIVTAFTEACTRMHHPLEGKVSLLHLSSLSYIRTTWQCW